MRGLAGPKRRGEEFTGPAVLHVATTVTDGNNLLHAMDIASQIESIELLNMIIRHHPTARRRCMACHKSATSALVCSQVFIADAVTC